MKLQPSIHSEQPRHNQHSHNNTHTDTNYFYHNNNALLTANAELGVRARNHECVAALFDDTRCCSSVKLGYLARNAALPFEFSRFQRPFAISSGSWAHLWPNLDSAESNLPKFNIANPSRARAKAPSRPFSTK